MKRTIRTSIIAGVVALSIVATAIPAPSANAQSFSELQAQIQTLLSQIQQLQGQISGQSSTVVKLTLTRDLKEGMTGEDVRQLQQFLNSDSATVVALSGAGSKGSETTYFGPATKAAVIKFQNKYRANVLTPVGLSQGTGFVGASTRAFIAQLGTTGGNTGTPNPSPTPTPKPPVTDNEVGQEGDITVTRGSEHTSTLELNGDTEKIYSVQIKAEDSPMTINRMDFILDKKPSRYIDTFTLKQNNKKVGEIKVTDSNIAEVSDGYRLRFSSLDAVVGEGKKADFVLEAKALRSLSSSRAADTLSVYMPRNGVRAIDTAKMITEEPSSDLASRTFDFRDADDDGGIIVSLSDKTPAKGVMQVKANSNTDNVTVMMVDVKADDSDITIDEMYVKVDSSEAVVSNVVRNLSLVLNGKTVATESVVKNGSNPIVGRDESNNSYTIIAANEYYVRFNNLKDIEIDEDDSETLTLKAEFFKQSGRYTSGTEVSFIIRALMGENKTGNNITAANLTTGDNELFYLYTDGLRFTMKDESAKTEGSLSRTGVYTLTFNVTAFGSDIYIPVSAARDQGTTTPAVTTYSVINANHTLYTGGAAVSALTIKDAKRVGNFFKISEGSTHTVTLKVSLDNTSATNGFYQVALDEMTIYVGSTTGTMHTISSGFEEFETSLTSIKS